MKPPLVPAKASLTTKIRKSNSYWAVHIWVNKLKSSLCQTFHSTIVELKGAVLYKTDAVAPKMASTTAIQKIFQESIAFYLSTEETKNVRYWQRSWVTSRFELTIHSIQFEQHSLLSLWIETCDWVYVWSIETCHWVYVWSTETCDWLYVWSIQ